MSLAGVRIIVSAGPTYEDIDPARFIGNRSSGKMGFAIAEAAASRDAEVVLVAGPVHLPTPAGVERIDVRSAADMHAAVMQALPASIYIGAAAVADFTPQTYSDAKLKKTPGSDTLTLELTRTRDILADVAVHADRPRRVVGFAAETHDIEHYARGKLDAKRIDMICANRVGISGSGFESDDNTLQVFWANGEAAIGPAPKRAVAAALLDLIDKELP